MTAARSVVAASRARTTSACALVSAESAVERSTEIHSMTASGSGRAPKIAFASSRARSTSNPAWAPLASVAAKGASASSTPTRILPFVWSAYM